MWQIKQYNSISLISIQLQFIEIVCLSAFLLLIRISSMSFQRKDFYDTIFHWYGVDTLGAIAQFTSVYSPIPKNVFNDESNYQFTDEYFNHLPKSTESYLSLKSLKEAKLSVNNFENPRNVANTGLYFFCEAFLSEGEGTENYEAITYPNNPLEIYKLPHSIQNYLSQLIFRDVIFKEVEKLSITKYFDCE